MKDRVAARDDDRSTTLRDTVASWAVALRAMLGVPDYDRYFAHVRRHRPGTVPLSRDEFARRCLEDRYSRPGSRCC